MSSMGSENTGALPMRYLGDWANAWNRFWFHSRLPHTLAVIRICCGAMLAYIHLIWAFCATDFMGANAWINREAINALHQDTWTWSWLWYIDSPTLLYAHQIVAVALSLAMMCGLVTRITVPLTWFITLMVCHRLTLALFGLDQIVIMLSMYLMISNSGSVWSLDARLRRNWKTGSWLLPGADATTNNQIATRLIQLHLCVIYLFGGLSKMRGEMWFDGIALWFTVANYEYQSMDLTWLGKSPTLISLLTGLTIFWETFYCALVWPKLSRPLALAMAVLVHGGIAIGLGMVTFGFIMIVANFAFISPEWVKQTIARRSTSA